MLKYIKQYRYESFIIFVCVLAVVVAARMYLTQETQTQLLPEQPTIEAGTLDTSEDDPEDTQEIRTMLAQAKVENADAVAWLTVTGTDIDNAVMQTTNNIDYLSLNEQGEYDGWGSYFADYYANLLAPDYLMQNTVIYGHAENPENPDGVRFSQLFRYLEEDFMAENPCIYLTIGEGDAEETLVFEVFAVFFTDIDFYYINPTPSDAGFDDFIDTVLAKNEYLVAEDSVLETDSLLTLSTCSHRYDTENTRDQRLVVMAKLVEDDTAQSAIVGVNASPVHP